jgi:hypothetical protein
MSTVASLLGFVMVIMIMSYAVGLMIKGPALANKIAAWQLKQLTRIGRSILKQVLQWTANLLKWIDSKL